jgi:hypothetical protein
MPSIGVMFMEILMAIRQLVQKLGQPHGYDGTINVSSLKA